MNLKYSIRTILFTVATVLTAGMNLVIATVRLVDSFSPQVERPKVSVRPRSCCRRGRFPLNTVSESSDARSPSPNGSAPRRNKVTNPPSSRSTAVFAMYESMRRQSTIAVRIMENDHTYKSLEGRDRAFARLLLTTAERRSGQIDKVIDALAHVTKTKKKPANLLCDAALRIGAAQILFLDTPAFAAVKETVDVLRMHPSVMVSDAQIKFVNAILRTIDREGQHLLGETSVMDNVNSRLAQEWVKSYGEQVTERIVDSAMSQSPVFITVNLTGKRSTEERNTELERVRAMFSEASGAEAQLLEHGSIRVPDELPSVVSNWPGYSDGEWWVQDPSASVPAIALEKILSKDATAKLGELHVVDLCSAPGGKTAQLCSFGFGHVTAVELSRKRTIALSENLERLRMKKGCEIVVADGREWQPENGDRVDAVLLDAPCSATGLGSRRPDVLHKSPDLQDITTLQRQLAIHAIDDLLKEGGIFVYATCSLLHSESEDQVRWLLSRGDGPGVENIPFEEGEIPGFDSAIDKNGWLRIIPGQLNGSHSQCDGFFVARLRRKNGYCNVP